MASEASWSLYLVTNEALQAIRDKHHCGSVHLVPQPPGSQVVHLAIREDAMARLLDFGFTFTIVEASLERSVQFCTPQPSEGEVRIHGIATARGRARARYLRSAQGRACRIQDLGDHSLVGKRKEVQKYIKDIISWRDEKITPSSSTEGCHFCLEGRDQENGLFMKDYRG